jgi:amino acid efflux transporter
MILSAVLATLFAAFGVRFSDSSGLVGYVRAGLGPALSRAARWLFLSGVITGAPVVSVVAGAYVRQALHLGRAATPLTAAVLLVAAITISQTGLRTSSGVQVALIVVLVSIVVLGIVTAARFDRTANWSPFAPNGWKGIGSAMATLMLSFIGWEASSPLVARLKSPRRDQRPEPQFRSVDCSGPALVRWGRGSRHSQRSPSLWA